MGIRDELAAWAREQGAEVQLLDDRLLADWPIARRRTHGGLRRLRYRLHVEVEERDRTVLLWETIWEADARNVMDVGPALRQRDEAYRIGTVWEKTAFETQRSLLKLTYDLDFDFANLRHRLEKVCQKAQFRLRQLIPV